MVANITESLVAQEREKAMYAELQELTEYYGEDFAQADPTRIMRTVRDFVQLFEKVLRDIKVWGMPRKHVGGLRCL